MTAGTDVRLRPVVGLREGTFSVRLPGGGRRLLAGHHAESFDDLDPGQDRLLLDLADGLRPDTAGSPLLDRLRDGGWLRLGVEDAGRTAYVLDPLRPPPPRSEPPDDPVLSRFAVLRRDGDVLLLESPRAWCDVRLHAPGAVEAVGRLVTGRPGAVPDELDRSLADDLRWAGLLVPRGAEETAFETRQWSPHELWFHEHSRDGHRAYAHRGFGSTRWADGTFAPLPARHEHRFPGPRIPLERADLDALRTDDPSLSTVLEQRSSIRRHDDDHPLTLAELGRFLYRACRTRGINTLEGVEYKSRPYPSGGGTYELEIYPVVRNVDGLDPGMYHYDAERHELVGVAPNGSDTRRILHRAALAARQDETPQVLLVVSARFGRLMWNYQAMAYALVLKHVGVLYQTLYLVATAMGLAACGLGSGNSLHFGDATGIDPLVEDNVGEFMLGRPAAGEQR